MNWKAYGDIRFGSVTNIFVSHFVALVCRVYISASNPQDGFGFPSFEPVNI